jgi:hypothetical protein
VAARSNVWSVDCLPGDSGDPWPEGVRGERLVRYLMVAAHSNLDLIEYVDEAKVVAYSSADSLLQGEPLFFWHELADKG